MSEQMPAEAPPAKTTQERMRRFLRLLVLVLLALPPGLALFPAGLGWLAIWGATHPFCTGGALPSDYGLTAEEVSVPSRLGLYMPGYFFAGTNGATIIIPPAFAQGRGGWLHEAAILVENGYSVLTYDGRPCLGFSPHSLGYWEADDILDALEYLRTRDDVDMTRIGLHGFSQAGASNLFAAAWHDGFRAVVAEGGYVDFARQGVNVGQPVGVFEALVRVGSRLAYRVATGMDVTILRPEPLVGDIAPNRVLLVYGQREGTLSGARRVAETHEHVDLWEVPGATHGSYLASAGRDEFTRHVVGFFDAVLLGEPAE